MNKLKAIDENYVSNTVKLIDIFYIDFMVASLIQMNAG